MFEDNELKEIEATWKNDESLAKIESNWKTFEKWCEQLGDRSSSIKEMLEHYGERACMAPASSNIEYHNAFPGGYIDHSLRVLKLTIDFATSLKVKIPKESLIISALFHDLGKLGTLEDDYYIFNESDWHRKRGMMYTKNKDIRMTNAQLSLFTLSQFNVKLSSDEYLAILLNDGQYVDENKAYGMKEPKLSLLVHFADRWATSLEKNRISLLDPEKLKF